MGTPGPKLRKETFERLREQIATASALCSEDQLLDLADGLHDTIRRRHREPGQEAIALQKLRERLSLSTGWPQWLTTAPFAEAHARRN